LLYVNLRYLYGMICLNCEKEFTPKRESAKYCSDNCRVKAYNKRSGKKAKPPMQMQVLITRLENALEKIEAIKIQPTVYDAPKVFNDSDEPMFPPKSKMVKSREYFQKIIKSGLELPEEFMTFDNDIDESDLPESVKKEYKLAIRIKQS
jgi:hypothetical protein